MPAVAKKELKPDHKEAIQLLKEGVPRKQICAKLNWSPDKLKTLISGNIKKSSIAALFKETLDKEAPDRIKPKKQETELDNQAKLLLKENKRLALSKLNQRLRALIPNTPTQKMSAELCSIIKVLSSATPTFEIKGDMHTHYHLTKQERANEFRRLLGKATEGIGRRLPESS